MVNKNNKNRDGTSSLLSYYPRGKGDFRFLTHCSVLKQRRLKTTVVRNWGQISDFSVPIL